MSLRLVPYKLIIGGKVMSVYRFSKRTQGQNNLTEHFKVSEFASHDGADEVFIDLDLVYKLEEIRRHFGSPIIISSGYRTPSWNKKVGGASGSFHTAGKAFDIIVKGVSPYDVAHFAQGLWIKGIGCYKDEGFVHIDARREQAFWYGKAVKYTDTFGNFPSCECFVRNVRLAHMTDGWTMPKHGITDSADDEEFLNILKASVVKRSNTYSNVVRIVQHTVGAGEDGIAGENTVRKIKEWQAENGLAADGAFGIQCWKKALGI